MNADRTYNSSVEYCLTNALSGTRLDVFTESWLVSAVASYRVVIVWWEAKVASRLKRNWSKTAYCTCAHLNLVLIHTCCCLVVGWALGYWRSRLMVAKDVSCSQHHMWFVIRTTNPLWNGSTARLVALLC